MIARSATKVFLDWEVLFDTRASFYTLELQFLTDLVNAGIVEVLTTDLVMIETCTARARYDLLDIVDLTSEHIRKIVAKAFGIDLPALARNQLWNLLLEKHGAEVSAVFTALKARQLSLDDTKPSSVFADYVAGKGFFDDSRCRGSFVNAMIFECLKREASKETPVIIVSKDADFDAPVEAAEHVSLVYSLPALFDALGLEVDRPDILEFLTLCQAEIIEALNHKLKEWLFAKSAISDGAVDGYDIRSIHFGNLNIYEIRSFDGRILIEIDMETMGIMHFTKMNWNNATYYNGLANSNPFLSESQTSRVEYPIDASIFISYNPDSGCYKIDDICIKRIDFVFNTLESPEDMVGYDD
jgi:hypothetical protein